MQWPLQLPADKKKQVLDKALSAMYHWVPRFSVITIGPGLGRDELVHETVKQVCLQAISCSPEYHL